jgi:hypothetical protein
MSKCFQSSSVRHIAILLRHRFWRVRYAAHGRFGYANSVSPIVQRLRQVRFCIKKADI